MFGLFKRKTAAAVGPFEFNFEIEIAASAEEVYALVDWSDPRNAQLTRGNKVEPVADKPDRFRLELRQVPGHVFEMTVTEADGSRYAFETEITPLIGKLVQSCEAYSIEPLDAHSCRVEQVVSASFAGGMAVEALAGEVMMMASACDSGLKKLKLQAEEGVEAVERFEAMQFA
jgi:hypothetical protein